MIDDYVGRGMRSGEWVARTRFPLHIALLAWAYPPNPIVGSVRARALAAAFEAAGHRVTVIRSTVNDEESPGFTRDGAVGVHAVRTPLNPLVLASRFMRSMEGQVSWDSTPKGHAPARRRISEGTTAIRRWMRSVLLVPDELQGFVWASIIALEKLHRHDRVDAIYSTSPPHSTQLAGWLAAHVVGVPWLADFRDPWIGQHEKASGTSSLSRWLDERLERLVIRKATRVVAVTPAMAGLINTKRTANGKPADTLTVLNGVPSVCRVGRSPGGALRVLHAGSLYLNRNPVRFLEAIASAIQRGLLDRSATDICFLGAHGGSFRDRSVLDMAESLGIGGSVRVEGQVSREECLMRLAQADALLLLAQEQPLLVPNKLYDYLAVGRPIIAYADEDGESAEMLRAIGGHCIVQDHSPGMTEAVIEAVLSARRTESGHGMNEALLAEFRTEVQMAKVVQAVEQAVRGSRA